MPDITQEITIYAGDAPNRNTQTNAEFSASADFFAGYFASAPAEYNAFATQANALRVEANSSKDSAAASAAISEANANFKGLWSDQTGSASVPYGVYHNGGYWQLVNNLADVTSSEPSVTSDWIESLNPLSATQITYNNAGTQTYTRQAVNTYVNRSGGSAVIYTLNESTFKVGDKFYVSKMTESAGVIEIKTDSGLIFIPDGASNATQTLDTVGTVCLEKVDTFNWVARAA